ncbi:MAG TPA: EF-Tu/IF-2/RF-3 family GTPase [Candidatus Thermoplasmatota archaeon]|nr:EF-Tu/IF-2/RF-3 family GTPase [Candidatus Thermoplasmatota archaeon]
MQQLTIGIFHDDSLAKDLGKKATESDMVLFHRKTDDQIFTFIYPVEDKIIPKSQITSMIDFAIISAEQITPALGETILMLDSIHIKKGIIIVEPYMDTAQLEKMIQDTSLSSFQIMPRDVHQIMEYLQNQNIKKDETASVAVTIDHSFHVKGVGEVILGFVNQGTVKKHDKLQLIPLNKEIIVRSIQMQDNDVEAAPAGSRVGLAIKGVKVDDLKRGYLLCSEETAKTSSTINLSFSKNPFYPEITTGKYHTTIGLQTVPISLKKKTDESISIETEKPIAYLTYQHVLILDLNADKLHHMGTGKIL